MGEKSIWIGPAIIAGLTVFALLFVYGGGWLIEWLDRRSKSSQKPSMKYRKMDFGDPRDHH